MDCDNKSFDSPEDRGPTDRAPKQALETPAIPTELSSESRERTLSHEQEEVSERRSALPEIERMIHQQPPASVETAIGHVEEIYRDFAQEWSREPRAFIGDRADEAMQPLKLAWSHATSVAQRQAIERSLHAALQRATSGTPGIQFAVAQGGDSLEIGGARSEGRVRPPHRNHRFLPALLATVIGTRLWRFLRKT